jgi:hypothetical protein
MTVQKNRLAMWCGALVSGLLVTGTLVHNSPNIGYVRDEGIYFAAAREHAQWIFLAANSPGRAFKDAEIRRHFRSNREHPSVIKFAAALAAIAWARPVAPPKSRDRANKSPGDAFAGGYWPLMSEGQAMRLPAQILSGLGVAALFAIGFSIASWAGALAASIGFVALPRVFFHSHLHAFDVPIAVACLFVALFHRAFVKQPNTARMAGLGVCLGVALGIKHNAFFLPPLLVVHALYVWSIETRKEAAARRLLAVRSIRLLVALAFIAPLVAWFLWPWMWFNTLEHLRDYLAFHREHSYYNTEYFGENLNRPPFPISYPFFLTLATVPSAWLLLALVGIGWALWKHVRQPDHADAGTAVLIAIFAFFPMALIAWPSVPIFGGTKHWITAYPFLAWGAAFFFQRANQVYPRLSLVLAGLIVVPGAMSIAQQPDLGLSQYNALVGGTRGAADLGLVRGFWGHAGVVRLFRAANELKIDKHAKVYLHDIHPLAVEQYRRDGVWPGWQPSRLAEADFAFFFPELHMRSDETKIWNEFGNVTPLAQTSINDVPVMMFYQRATKP